MHLFKRTRQRDTTLALYESIVAQARQSEFYIRCGVPDTVDGRFDMIALHAFMVVRRIKDRHRDAAQALLEAIFDDMDHSLREMGAGDLGVPRRVKAMAKALYGRISAYDEALGGGAAALENALKRNLYGTVEPAPRSVAVMAAYVAAAVASLEDQASEDIVAGMVSFPSVPADEPDVS